MSTSANANKDVVASGGMQTKRPRPSESLPGGVPTTRAGMAVQMKSVPAGMKKCDKWKVKMDDEEELGEGESESERIRSQSDGAET